MQLNTFIIYIVYLSRFRQLVQLLTALVFFKEDQWEFRKSISISWLHIGSLSATVSDS